MLTGPLLESHDPMIDSSHTYTCSGMWVHNGATRSFRGELYTRVTNLELTQVTYMCAVICGVCSSTVCRCRGKFYKRVTDLELTQVKYVCAVICRCVAALHANAGGSSNRESRRISNHAYMCSSMWVCGEIAYSLPREALQKSHEPMNETCQTRK